MGMSGNITERGRVCVREGRVYVRNAVLVLESHPWRVAGPACSRKGASGWAGTPQDEHTRSTQSHAGEPERRHGSSQPAFLALPRCVAPRTNADESRPCRSANSLSARPAAPSPPSTGPAREACGMRSEATVREVMVLGLTRSWRVHPGVSRPPRVDKARGRPESYDVVTLFKWNP